MSGFLQQCGKEQTDPETYLNVPMHLKTQGMLQASWCVDDTMLEGLSLDLWPYE